MFLRKASFLLPAALAVATAFSGGAYASSHREAPFIAGNPRVDGTDFYMFNSYETGRTGFLTVIANYYPLEDGFGGPNYFPLDPAALYEISFDTNGDGKEDITFQFRFQNNIADIKLPVGGTNVSIPLVAAGPLGGANAPLNVSESYTIDMVSGDRRAGTHAPVTNGSGGSTFTKPTDFIGVKTFGSVAAYESYAESTIQSINIPGCNTPGRVFVGQRRDPFAISLGHFFDLLNFNPTAQTVAQNDLANKNVTSIEMELPISCIASSTDPVIGAWTTASLRQAGLLRYPVPSGYAQTIKSGGAWVQVSRLGMPLVNEVVIGLKDKDTFNGSSPSGDAQFATYVTNPTAPALVQAVLGAPAPTNFPRQDLVNTFLTGFTGINQPKNVVPAEMLRLNTSIAPTVIANQNALGVLGGDNAGFPNGRRPVDDVVTSTVRVAMGVLCTLNNPAVFGCKPSDAPAGALPLTVGGLNSSSGNFLATFPYLATPVPGAAD
jgi:hypothetical protein